MTPSEILDIIIIIYFVPAFAFSLMVVFKHGFSKDAGWISLVLLSIFRLVGSAMGIAAVYKPSTGVIAASLILANMGTVSLLAAVLGVIKRANSHMVERSLPQRILRFSQLPTLIAVILAIIGGNQQFDSDPAKQSQGRTLTKAAIILLLIVFLIAVFITAYTTIFRRFVLPTDMRLVKVSIVAAPLVLIRLILAFLSAFRSTDPNFGITSRTNTAIIVRALMGTLTEFIVVGIFLWAGLTVDITAERQLHNEQRNVEAFDNPPDKYTQH